jgi:hypothetical protein
MGNLADLWVCNNCISRVSGYRNGDPRNVAEIVIYSAKMKVCNGVESIL